jgi:hypothetical protein
MAFAVSDVKPGEVLLFHGKSFTSWAIRKFDGSEVNHAALALPGGMLAEAGGKGLQTRAIPTPGGGEYILVHQLKASKDLDPVVTKANAFLADGHLYAYQQIVLLGLLTLTRRIPLPGLARRLMRAALDHATKAVMDLLPVGSSWMICSEYVYRSFDEAVDGEPDLYPLSIAGISFADAGGNGDPPLIDWAIENAADVEIAPPKTFGAAGPPTDHVQRIAAIEADLAPLVIDYAERLYAAGEITDDDLPPLIDASFGIDATALPPEPTDDDMLRAAATFTAAFTTARGQPLPGVDAGFGAGAVGMTIASAALKGALQGIKTMQVNGDFVTPGDLLGTPSLERIGRLG